MLTALQGWGVAHNLLAAAVALAATLALRRRPVSRESRPAALALRLFWAGLAATALVQTGMVLLAARGAGPGVALATTLLAFGTAVVALGALAAYFLFLVTGWRPVVPLVACLYGAVALLGAWEAMRAVPTGLALTRWGYEVAYAGEGGLSPSVAQSAAALAALVPAILGAVGFLAIGLRSTGATRQRGILVGLALALWFGTLALPVESDAADVARKLASMAGFVAIYLAYLPPKALQARWGLVRLGRRGRVRAAPGRAGGGAGAPPQRAGPPHPRARVTRAGLTPPRGPPRASPGSPGRPAGSPP